jgi:glycosyltransferase involved in cell wall biosynthesis
MIKRITPLILTYNEAPNIGRTLERLRWAGEVVIVDSFSEDETLEVVSGFPNARVFRRRFDSHEKQWNFGLRETGITSEWVLALDADYILTPELIDELKSMEPGDDVAGFSANFIYCINGRPLRGSAYPPVTVLYRRAKALYRQDGHTQRVIVDGKVEPLRAPILHDDRKPLAHWLQSQARYMRIEARKLAESDSASLALSDRVRKMRVVAPFLMLLYCLVAKRAILDGKAGLFYAFQRTVAELILSLYLVEDDLRRMTQRKNEKPVESALPTPSLVEGKEQG